jgi:hypothetical protein
VNGLRKRVERDGFVWCYELTHDCLRLKLFRCIPVGRIRLRDVIYIRQRSAGDLAEWWRDFFFKPFRSWYWPHPLMSYSAGSSTAYIIRTRNGRNGCRIYVRLRGGFHYQLRAAMGHARVAADPSGAGGLKQMEAAAGASK